MPHLKLSDLIFLTLGAAMIGCSPNERKTSVEIIWIDNKATEIELSNSSVIGLSEESLPSILKVELGDTGEPMLGRFFKRNGHVVFQPVVPFTRGMHYHILANDVIFFELDIPSDESANAPQVSIFPSADTVPENILKMYFHFSEPMAEGKSIQFIHLINSDGDTLYNTFLELQPELWNSSGTILTLWFDPGRVKRDLIPNQQLGNPILKNESYTLIVSGSWRSKSGKEIGNITTKEFQVKERDERIPDLEFWTLAVPPSGSREKLKIDFSEPLDYSLIQSTIQITDGQGNVVEGEFSVQENERGIEFTSRETWNMGEYILKVESRLEDLAGNNLVRPFDRDITASASPIEQKYFERTFKVK